MAVTKETVAAACDQIAADGKTVTQSSVRAIVGGSYTTIGPFIAEWREDQGKTETLAKIEVPVEVTQATASYEASIWKVATESARAGQEAMRVELIETKAQAKQQTGELGEIIAEVEVERDAAVADRDKITAERDALAATSDDLTKTVAALNVDLVAALARADAGEADASRSKSDTTAANEDRIQMRTERDNALTALDQCRSKMSDLSELKDKIEADAKVEIERIRAEAKAEAAVMRQEAKADAAAMRAEVSGHADRADKLSSELVACTERAVRAEEKAVALQSSIERMTTELAALKAPA